MLGTRVPFDTPRCAGSRSAPDAVRRLVIKRTALARRVADLRGWHPMRRRPGSCDLAVSYPVSPAASSAGVAVLPPLMSPADADSSKNPAWFVVFVTVAVIGTPEPEPKPEGPHRPRTAMSCLLRTEWHRT